MSRTIELVCITNAFIRLAHNHNRAGQSSNNYLHTGKAEDPGTAHSTMLSTQQSQYGAKDLEGFWRALVFDPHWKDKEIGFWSQQGRGVVLMK